MRAWLCPIFFDARRALNPESMAFVFTRLATGKTDTVGYQYGSLNHLQFNPRDPDLLLYCHEGTWHEVDRIWTIRTDGSGMTLRHKRTMDMEIAGHEFWSFDGRHIWFDLQTPRSQVFWIAGVNLETGHARKLCAFAIRPLRRDHGGNGNAGHQPCNQRRSQPARRTVSPLAGRLSQHSTVNGAPPAPRRRRKASTRNPGALTGLRGLARSIQKRRLAVFSPFDNLMAQ